MLIVRNDPLAGHTLVVVVVVQTGVLLSVPACIGTTQPSKAVEAHLGSRIGQLQMAENWLSLSFGLLWHPPAVSYSTDCLCASSSYPWTNM